MFVTPIYVRITDTRRTAVWIDLCLLGDSDYGITVVEKHIKLGMFLTDYKSLYKTSLVLKGLTYQKPKTSRIIWLLLKRI